MSVVIWAKPSPLLSTYLIRKIVIAGEITEADKVLLPAIESCINTQALKAFRTNLPVVRSELDHRSAIGAFALVKRAMLNGILLQHLLEN